MLHGEWISLSQSCVLIAEWRVQFEASFCAHSLVMRQTREQSRVSSGLERWWRTASLFCPYILAPFFAVVRMTTLLWMLTDYGQSCQRALPASSRRTTVLVRSRIDELDLYASSQWKFWKLNSGWVSEVKLLASSRWPEEDKRVECL
jgi:hypothetical protein